MIIWVEGGITHIAKASINPAGLFRRVVVTEPDALIYLPPISDIKSLKSWPAERFLYAP